MQKEIQDIMKSEDAVKEAIENYRKFSTEVKDLERLGNKVNQIEQNNDIRIKEGFKCIEDEIKNIEDKFSEFKAETDNRFSDRLSGALDGFTEDDEVQVVGQDRISDMTRSTRLSLG